MYKITVTFKPNSGVTWISHISPTLPAKSPYNFLVISTELGKVEVALDSVLIYSVEEIKDV